MSVKQRPSEVCWGGSQPQSLYKFSSPLWSAQSALSNDTWSNHSSSSSTTSVDLSIGDSSRAIQLRYTDIMLQLKQCRELEAQLLQQQEKIVRSMFISNRDYGFVPNCISPPGQDHVSPPLAPSTTTATQEVPPPSRETMLSRLIEGQREEYRRIFVPGRGWISKLKLQNELQVSEVELERMAGLGC